MITKKHITIPIYGYRLTVIIFDEWRELKGYIPDSELDYEARGITFSNSNCGLIAVASDAESTITHEAYHIVNDIWKYIGYTAMEANDEVGAYLITYLVEEIKKIWDRHNSTKK